MVGKGTQYKYGDTQVAAFSQHPLEESKVGRPCPSNSVTDLQLPQGTTTKESPVLFVSGIDIRPSVYQQLTNCRPAHLSCQNKWCPPVYIFGIHRGPVVTEQLDAGRTVCHGLEKQRDSDKWGVTFLGPSKAA